ncbi:discoidin, CUB and LCCL domain-containing protein 2-like [Branchiostoma floridae x Branchiostoma japonicum]
MVNFRVISRFLLCLCICCLLPVAKSDDTVDCSTKFTDFDDDINTFTVTCPADCSDQYSARVWGTGIYRSDSSICRAAIHDGRITDDGGQVTVYKWPGLDSYQGSYKNGVRTSYKHQFPSWPVSFAFTRDTVWCSTDSTVFDDDPFTVTCPAGCSDQYSPPDVCGTGVYRSGSSICRAAIHDGRITDDGGQVTVYRWPGQDLYQGSTQNGVQTYYYSMANYYSRDSSFAFTRVCRDALGMENGTIEDGDITASSYQQSRPPSAARLNGNSAWFPSEPFEGSWIQVDLGQQKTVSGVITQGYSWNYRVTQYQVRYVNNNGTWVNVTSPTGHAMTFSGNTDPNGQKTHMFYRTIVTQQVRLYPTRWPDRVGPALRMELLGCDLGSTTQSTTAMRTTYSTQSTTVIKTTSITQPTTVTRTTSSASQRTVPSYASSQTVGPFSSVTSSTAELIDGDHEKQEGTKGPISVGAIAGIAAAVAVVLIAMVVFVIIFLRKRQSNNKSASNVPRGAPELIFRNPEYSDATVANEHTALAQEEGYTDCELYNNTEDNNPYEL